MSKFTLTVVVGLLLATSVAHAQTGSWSPYSTSVYNEGPGFRLGNTALVIHPGLGIEGGYDSNVFYLSHDAIGSGLLRIRAHIDLATLPPQRREGDTAVSAEQKLEFRLSTQAEYREYLSNIDQVKAQRSFNLYANADLAILPHAPITLRLFDNFVRTADPRNAEGVQNFTSDFNRVGFLLSFRPHMGKLEFGVGDYFQFNLWEDEALRKLGDTIQNEAQAFFRVHFLEKTTGALTVRSRYVRFTNNNSLEAIPLRITASLASQITSWFGAAASIGYGNSFHKNGPSFNSAIAHVEARFFLPLSMKLGLAYDRDFFESIFANFYADDRLSLGFEMPLTYRLTARVDGGMRFRHYDGLVLANTVGYSSYLPTGNDRSDKLYDAHAELGIRATTWLDFNVSYNMIVDTTDFRFVNAIDPVTKAPVGMTAVDPSYVKHAVFVRADFAY